MTGQELATSVLEGLPIVVVIVNNGYLGMVRQWQDMFFDERQSQIHLTKNVPDYAKLAEAYGGVGLTVDNEDDLEGVLQEALTCGRTAVRRRTSRRRRAVLPDDPRRCRGTGPRRVRGRRGRAREGGRGVKAHVVGARGEQGRGRSCGSRACSRVRGFNIESLSVGVTERHDVSRITMRVDCEQHPLEQIEKQMHKLVNVLRVSELEPGEAVERELALMKVTATPARRGELIALSQAFNARVADLGSDSIVFEIVGHPEEIDSFEELVRPHGLKELVRTGRIGIGRSATERGEASPTARPHLTATPKEKPDGNDPPRRKRRPPLGQGRRPGLREPGARARR
jgi:acetolactate synthase-1/3 small subunit